MRNRDFSAACLTVLLLSAIFFSVLLYVPQFMERILGYSPLKSGAALLPMMGTFALTSFIAGPLYGRLGPKLIVTLGAAAIGVGILLLSLIGQNATYASLVVGLLILGIGVGLFYSSVTTAGVTALDASRAALAGGIVYMFQVAGGSVGLGANTTLFTTRSQNVLDSHIAALGTK
jgi:MFS family permease